MNHHPPRAPRRQQRPPWFADICFACAHVATFCVGLLSEIGGASPSVAHILGNNTFGLHIWAFIFMFFGAIALIANLWKKMRVEAISVLCIGGGFVLWSLMIFIDPHRPSIESAFGYLVIAFIKTGWGATLLWWIDSSLVVVDSRKILHEGEGDDGGITAS